MAKLDLKVFAINSQSRDEALRLRNEELWVTAHTIPNVIIAGPEQLKSKEYEKSLCNEDFYKHCCGLGFDEVHLLNVWGVSFRKDFLQMGFVKARLPNAHNPWILTTATLRDGRPADNVYELLGMQPGHFHLICRSNLRPEIQILF